MLDCCSPSQAALLREKLHNALERLQNPKVSTRAMCIPRELLNSKEFGEQMCWELSQHQKFWQWEIFRLLHLISLVNSFTDHGNPNDKSPEPYSLDMEINFSEFQGRLGTPEYSKKKTVKLFLVDQELFYIARDTCIYGCEVYCPLTCDLFAYWIPHKNEIVLMGDRQKDLSTAARKIQRFYQSRQLRK